MNNLRQRGRWILVACLISALIFSGISPYMLGVNAADDEAIGASESGNVAFMRSPVEYTIGAETTGTWDYVEYTGRYNYEIQIAHTAGLEKGALREIEIDLDPFDVGESSLFIVSTYPTTAKFINDAKLSGDRKTLTYIVDNDALLADGGGGFGTITFSLNQSPYFATTPEGEGKKTTYYKNATLASNIGVMLLDDPNARIGIEMREGTDPANSVLLEHEIKRDNHGELSLIDDTFITSNGTSASSKALQELYLGSDGYLYFSENAGATLSVLSGSYTDEDELVSAPVNYYRMNLVNEDHAPIGDPKIGISVPDEFRMHGYAESVPEYIPEYLNADTSETMSVDSVRDTTSGGTTHYASSPGSLYTTLTSNIISNDNELQQMLTAVRPTTQAYAALKVTGNSQTSISAINPLYTYLEESYTSKKVETEYNQVIYNEGTGKYEIEAKNESYDEMVINIPDYDYSDLISMEASVPEKVNDGDPPGTKYKFSIFNNVTSYIDDEGQKKYTNTNVRDNKAPYFHNDGEMTLNFEDSNFIPSHLSLSNGEGEFTRYTIRYADGTESESVSVLGEINIPLEPLDGSAVKEITFEISERGLVERGKASGYETSGYFYGEFIEPVGTNSIQVPVTFESKGNGPESLLEGAKVTAEKKITWEYEDTIDSVHIYQDVDRTGVTGGELLINGSFNSKSPAMTSGIAIPKEVDQSADTYRNFRMDLFDKSYIDDLEVDDKTKEQMRINIDAALAQLGRNFLFNGDSPNVKFQETSEDQVWMEYTTNLNPEPRKEVLEIGKNKIEYINGLQIDEYFTSMVFCADYVKAFGYDDEYYSTGFDVIEIIDKFEFVESRFTGAPIVDHGTVVDIRAKATADGLGDTYTPETGEQKEQSKNKTLSNSYASTKSDLKLNYKSTAMVTTLYSDYGGKPEPLDIPTDVTSGTPFESGPYDTIDIDLPIFSGASNAMYGGNVYFPKGTYGYLQLNTEQFKYVGNNNYIRIVENDGKTWLVYDMSTLDLKNSGGWDMTIPQKDFVATDNVKVNTAYPLFLDSYVDVGSLFEVDPVTEPYIEYKPTDNFNQFALEDVHGLKALNPEVKYDGKRFVQLNTDATIDVNVATSTNILLYPGIEEQVEGYGSVTYHADDFNKLNLNFDIGSPIRTFKNYHLVLTLPREGKTYQNPSMTEAVESDLSLYLRELDKNVVTVSDNVSAKVEFASEYSFDEADVTSSKVNYTEAKNIEDAKYVIVSIDEIEYGDYVEIDIDLAANEDAMYESDHQYKSYASAESRFQFSEEETTTAETIFNVGTSYATTPAEYIFEWYALGGFIFEDATSYPYFVDGLNLVERPSFDRLGEFYFLDLNTLDSNGKPTEMIAEDTTTNTNMGLQYRLLLQPKKVLNNESSYNIALDIAKIEESENTEAESVSFTPTINTSDNNSYSYARSNNNAPREGGIEILATTEGFKILSKTGDNIPHASEYEVAEELVNYGIYKNPSVDIEATIVKIKEGTTGKVELEITGTGTFKEGSIYNPIDGTQYVNSQIIETGNAKTREIEMFGKDVTFDSATGNYIYKDATTTIINYFGEEITVVNKYMVYSDPFVTFHTNPKDEESLKGSWHDTTIEETHINAKMNLADENATEGTIHIDQVPGLDPPKGYLFLGWQTKDGVPVPFDTNLTTFENYEQLYPIYEKDTIGEKGTDGEDVGDGIYDKYQMKYIYVAANPNEVIVKDNKYPSKKSSEVIDRYDAGGEYSETAATSPTGTGFTVATDENYYTVTGWKFYYLDGANKVYIEDPLGNELFVENTVDIKNQEFDTPGVIYIEAQNVTHSYNVHFSITQGEGTVVDGKLLNHSEVVAIGKAVEELPTVNPAPGYRFIGWYILGDPDKKLIDPRMFTVFDRDLYFHALLEPIESVPQTGDSRSLQLFMILTIASLIGIGGYLARRKKES